MQVIAFFKSLFTMVESIKLLVEKASALLDKIQEERERAWSVKEDEILKRIEVATSDQDRRALARDLARHLARMP